MGVLFPVPLWVGVIALCVIALAAYARRKQREIDTRACPECDERIGRKARRCPHCGQPVIPAAGPAYSVWRANKTSMILLGIFVALIGIVAISQFGHS